MKLVDGLRQTMMVSDWGTSMLMSMCVSMCVCFSYLANKYLRQYHSHSVEQEVEWSYAFDVHINAFSCSFMLTYVLQVCVCDVYT